MATSGLQRGICHVPEPGEPDHVFWFGFDTGHAFDFAPGMRAALRHTGLPDIPGETYRDLNYVRAECRLLAAQLAAME